jgi:hypothetical protein
MVNHRRIGPCTSSKKELCDETQQLEGHRISALVDAKWQDQHQLPNL